MFMCVPAPETPQTRRGVQTRGREEQRLDKDRVSPRRTGAAPWLRPRPGPAPTLHRCSFCTWHLTTIKSPSFRGTGQPSPRVRHMCRGTRGGRRRGKARRRWSRWRLELTRPPSFPLTRRRDDRYLQVHGTAHAGAAPPGHAEPPACLSPAPCSHTRSGRAKVSTGVFTPQKPANATDQNFFFFCRQLAVKYSPARHITVCVRTRVCVRVKICMFYRDRHTCAHRDIMRTHCSRLCAPLIHNSSLHSL